MEPSPTTPLLTFALIAKKPLEPLTVFPVILPTEKPELDELTLERVLEELETLCHQNMAQAIETQEGLGIEYDEDVVCDVCRSPEGEDGNEMVFCDKCNVCVHQVGGPCHSHACCLSPAEAGCPGFRSMMSTVDQHPYGGLEADLAVLGTSMACLAQSCQPYLSKCPSGSLSLSGPPQRTNPPQLLTS